MLLMRLMIQSAAASRPQPRLTSELYVTLRHYYTRQPKWPKKIWKVYSVNCSKKKKIPHFVLSSTTLSFSFSFSRCCCGFISSLPPSCVRVKQLRFPRRRRLRRRILTTLQQRLFFGGSNRWRGPILSTPC